MAKAPAVQFYVSDFLTGTTLMTNEEVGLYIRLLCLQAENGSVPDDPERMSIVYGPSVAKCWPAVRAKFISGEQPGTMVNEKMVKVLADREAFRKKQSDKGKASAEARLSYGSKKKKPRLNRGSTVVEPLEGEGRGIVKKEERANEVEVVWPAWAGPQTLARWEEFKSYRWEEHKVKYKSPKTEQQAVNILAKFYTNGKQCVDALDTATGKLWKFPVDPKELAAKSNGFAGKPIEATITNREYQAGLAKARADLGIPPGGLILTEQIPEHLRKAKVID